MSNRDARVGIFLVIVLLPLLIAVAIRGAVGMWETDVARSIGWLWFAGFFLFCGIAMLVNGLLKLRHGASSAAPVHATEQVRSSD